MIDPDWVNKHQNGWILYRKKERLAELLYQGLDGFAHIFKVCPFISNEDFKPHLLALLDSSRVRGDYYLKNKNSIFVLEDQEFTLSESRKPGVVFLRECSNPKTISWLAYVIKKIKCLSSKKWA